MTFKALFWEIRLADTDLAATRLMIFEGKDTEQKKTKSFQFA